jgi:hypothetical protein
MGASNQPAVHRRLSTSPETVWLTEMVLSFAPLSKSQGPRRSARVIDRHASARQPAASTHRLDDLADFFDHELRLLPCLFLSGIGDVELLAKWGKGI